jgi:hypothetical protein
MAQTTVTLYKPVHTANIAEHDPGGEIFGDDSFSNSAKAIGIGADGATTYVIEHVVSRWPDVADYLTQNPVTTTKFEDIPPFTATCKHNVQFT